MKKVKPDDYCNDGIFKMIRYGKIYKNIMRMMNNEKR